MEPYLFQGIVLPERASISFQLEFEFSQVSSQITARAKLSILLNQIMVWVYSDHNWDIHDLRNIVIELVRTQLDVAGYIYGHAYECQITRVVNQSRGVDYVFGIDVPCLANRYEASKRDAAIDSLRRKTGGDNGFYIRRCLADLSSAMKYAADTGFYCYRAIEALRLHCAAINGLSDKDKGKQWERFRSVSGNDEQSLRGLEAAAKPTRHGDAVDISGTERARLLTLTWDIVDKYLATVPAPN